MFSHALRLGKILGIELELDLTWFIILGLVALSYALRLPLILHGLPVAYYWLLGLLIALLLFVSVVLHELAHSVLAKRNGLGISGITLFLFGGVSKLTKEPNSATSELAISVVGPAVSLLLAGIFFLGALLPLGAVVKTVLGILALINLMLAIFNLLPGLPLDGGRVLRALVWQATGDFSQATRVASYSGQGIGLLLILLGVIAFFSNGLSGIWIAFIGWFMVQAAQSSYQQSVLRRMLSGVRVNSVMSSNVTTVPASTNLEELVHDYFLALNYSAFPVVRDGEVVGVVTLADVRQVPREKWPHTPVGEILKPLRSQQVVTPQEDAWEALSRMLADGDGRLLVMSNGHLDGIVSRTNIMRLIRTKMELGA